MESLDKKISEAFDRFNAAHGGDYYIFRWRINSNNPWKYQIDKKGRIITRSEYAVGNITLGAAYSGADILQLLQ